MIKCKYEYLIQFFGMYTFGSNTSGLSPLNLCLTVYFTDRSKAVLLLWIIYVFFCLVCCYVFVRACLFVPFGHLLGKG